MRKRTVQLDYGALQRELKTEGPKNFYMLWGPEEYLIRNFTQQVRKACLMEGMDDFNAKCLEGPLVSTEELKEALDAMPFPAGRTVVELRGVDANRCRDEELLQALEDIPEWCTVILTLPSEVRPDGRLENIKRLKKLGGAVEFTAQGQTALYRWISLHFQSGGKSIGREAMDRLLFLSGDLMYRLAPEIEKICTYAQGPEATVEDVEQTAHHIPEADAFRMTDCISHREYDKAVGLLEELLAQDEEPIALLGAIGWQLRRIYAARLGLDSGAGPDYARKVMHITNEYSLRLTMESARGFRLETLAFGLRLCAEMDWRLKTSGGDGNALLWEFLIRFAMEARRA